MILKVGNVSTSNTLESIWVEVQRGSIPAGVTPSALVEIQIQTGVTPSTTPWLLATGIWNDGGEWIDTEVWID